MFEKYFVTCVITGKIFDSSVYGGGIFAYDKSRSKHYIIGIVKQYVKVKSKVCFEEVSNYMTWIKDNLKIIHIQKDLRWPLNRINSFALKMKE